MKKIFVNRENLKYNIEKIKQYAPILDNGQEYTIQCQTSSCMLYDEVFPYALLKAMVMVWT